MDLCTVKLHLRSDPCDLPPGRTVQISWKHWPAWSEPPFLVHEAGGILRAAHSVRKQAADILSFIEPLRGGWRDDAAHRPSLHGARPGPTCRFQSHSTFLPWAPETRPGAPAQAGDRERPRGAAARRRRCGRGLAHAHGATCAAVLAAFQADPPRKEQRRGGPRSRLSATRRPTRVRGGCRAARVGRNSAPRLKLAAAFPPPRDGRWGQPGPGVQAARKARARWERWPLTVNVFNHEKNGTWTTSQQTACLFFFSCQLGSPSRRQVAIAFRRTGPGLPRLLLGGWRTGVLHTGDKE